MPNQNMSDKEEIIANILSSMRKSTSAWKDVADELLKAKTKFGGSSSTYKEIMQECKFSKATASKLCAIAEDDRLKDHVEIFGPVDSWTTLYLVTRIEGDDAFKEFVTKVKRDLDDKPITGAYVQRFLSRDEAEMPMDPFRSLFDVSIDSDVMKAGDFGAAEYDDLREKLLDIQAQFAGVIKVKDRPAYENAETMFFDKVKKAEKRLLNKMLSDALDAWDKTHKPKDLIIGRYKKRSDLREDFKDNEFEILEEFNVDVDRDKLNQDAEREVRKQMADSIAKRKEKESNL